MLTHDPIDFVGILPNLLLMTICVRLCISGRNQTNNVGPADCHFTFPNSDPSHEERGERKERSVRITLMQTSVPLTERQSLLFRMVQPELSTGEYSEVPKQEEPEGDNGDSNLYVFELFCRF
jgi:hypothetical protein